MSPKTTTRRTGIVANFKPKPGARKIEFAQKEAVKKSADWSVKAYASIFRKLAE